MYVYGKSENLRIMWQRDLDNELEQEFWDNNNIHNVGWPVRDIKPIYTLLNNLYPSLLDSR